MEQNEATKKRIALGLSGGVDSAVSVALLQHAGYEVVGVTCRFQDDTKTEQAITDASIVCKHFDIEHVVWDACSLFTEKVIQPFVDTYAQGDTPSPCVGCNAQVKVPALMAAAKAHNCTKVATGHYARIAQLNDSGRFFVKTALDTRKDQSYMLALLSQEQLAHLVLPLGGITKAEVRILAGEMGLQLASKADSQDICFIEGDYRAFLIERGMSDVPGSIVNKAGAVLGAHTGLSNYTLGQRKGIGVAAPEPYYVIEKRTTTNELVVGTAQEAQVREVLVGEPNWQAFETLEEPKECMVKLRYRSTAAACTVYPENNGCVRVSLVSPQSATAPGQYAVFYLGSAVWGGGVIKEVRA